MINECIYSVYVPFLELSYASFRGYLFNHLYFISFLHDVRKFKQQFSYQKYSEFQIVLCLEAKALSRDFMLKRHLLSLYPQNSVSPNVPSLLCHSGVSEVGRFASLQLLVGQIFKLNVIHSIFTVRISSVLKLRFFSKSVPTYVSSFPRGESS